MRRVVSYWVWPIVVFAVLAAMVFLRGSEADRIRTDLESMADALGFQEGTSAEARMAGLKMVLAERVANPVTIAVEPTGESSWDADSLAENMLAYTAGLLALRIDLHDIGLKLDTDQKRATAKGEATLDTLDALHVRHSEPRRFAARLERGAKGWVIVHAQIAAPRIDQPEARP